MAAALPTKAVEIRSKLVEALKLDLVGPAVDPMLGDPAEVLSQAPSRWYLTGFLAPLDSAPEQKASEDSAEEVDEAGETGGTDDDVVPERAAARQRYLPSSIGLSVIVPAHAERVFVDARWGDYRRRPGSPEQWERNDKSGNVTFDLNRATPKPHEIDVPQSIGLRIAYLARPVGKLDPLAGLPDGTRTVSVFLVNRRRPAPDETKDEAFAFQVELSLRCEAGFLPRPNLRSMGSDDWDECVADVQYRDANEYAVGHNVATYAVVESDNGCHAVRTCWIPESEVEHVSPAKLAGVELGMDALAELKDGDEAQSKLIPLVSQYRKWIKMQAATAPKSPQKRRATAEELLHRAHLAATRIEAGIALLSEEKCLKAFKLANKCMAAAARRRSGVMQGKTPESIQPAWRPFQLAFLLMNLKGIAQPGDTERDIVDLLFFPTGGGKTEAYLGLAAFTLVLRRLINPGINSAGVSVLMRYTLRLLTLDQLSRAATLICALELERQNNVDELGEWPFEIGLWVGRAATPNQMGKRGDNDPESARLRTLRFVNDSRKPSPIPLEECPWCGTKFTPTSFRLLPDSDQPRDLRISCVNRNCAFSRGVALPIVAVDEPIYRRLPCFIIATVDKFAALPWTGRVGAFFGRVERHDRQGFYGPCDPILGSKIPAGQLLPPDLIIQDELHLISGPLGTMAGLYETAIDELCARTESGKVIRPKIIASTATVRRAETQIRALFARYQVDIFPPPGPNRRNSFFAETLPISESNGRLYVGVAAQGRSPKVAMLRVYLVMLGNAQKWFLQLKKKDEANPADPYMTIVGYFNALRELGGARRLIEDEVLNRLRDYGSRKRVGESEGLFSSREIAHIPVELTSRVNTADVADAKRRLALTFDKKDHVDVAIATNMISVGLDIIRLGLMVVFGQPKTAAEYIQATSRVGREVERPGLIVTIFNVHKPRDRSHYERFTAYHQSFYRSVEATSVTPFSPRALDKGLAATLVGLARQGYRAMTPPLGAAEILKERLQLEAVVQSLSDRAYVIDGGLPQQDREKLKQRVRERAKNLLDTWSKVAQEYQAVGVALQYNPVEEGGAKQLLYDYLSPEVKNLPPENARMKFRATRSLRDVEAQVNVWVRTLENVELEEETV